MPFRLLLVSNLFPPHARGGAEWVAADLAAGLSERGHSVHVLTSLEPLSPASDEPGTMSPGPFTVSRLLRLHGAPPMALPGRVRHLVTEEYYDAGNAAIVREEIRRVRPDIVYINAPTGLSHSPLWAAARSGLPLIVHLHDYWLRSALEHGKLGPLNRSLFATLKDRVRFIAVSGRLRDLHVEAGVPADRIVVIRNGIRSVPDPISSPRTGDVLYCGRVTRAKGLHLAARAAVSDGFDLALLGGGDEEYLAECREIAGTRLRELGRVPRPDVASVMARHKVLVLPSLWEEPCPLVVLEAMAAGCVPIVSRRGGMPEQVGDGTSHPCGVVVPVDDAVALGRAVRSLLDDEPRRAALAAAGLDAVNAHGRWTRQLEELEEECASLIAYSTTR